MKAKHFPVPKRFRLASVKHHPEFEYGEYEKRLRSIRRLLQQMMAKTSRPAASWYVVPANNKKYARIAALKILVDQLGRGVALTPRPIDPALAGEASRLFDVSPYELE